MRYVSIVLVLGLTLVSSQDTAAQQWTPEQQEVWDFETRCYQVWVDGDFEGRKSCIHEDYSGWYSGFTFPVPYNERLDKRQFDKTKPVGFSLMPHRISIYGNVAVIQYSVSLVEEDAEGKDTTSWQHWTDIALKEDGQWSWIADHGHPRPSN